jgi:hypothetical protein
MHFVGKILVVLLLILSVLFMAFAGAVYNTHIKWRDATNDQKKLVAARTKERDDKEAEMQAFKTDMDKKVKDAKDREATVDAENRGHVATIAKLQKDNSEINVARKTAAEQAQIAEEEALARREESQNLRKINHDQAQKLDANFEEKTKLEDLVHSLQIDLATAKAKNKDLLVRNSHYIQALETAGISSDVGELAAKSAPPPRVEGIIEEVQAAKRQGASELVEISLGSDDGLKKGHEMTVSRSGLKGGQRAKFLGMIRIVKTYPDKAVGEVIEGTRNGVIQKGDNVTTKL